MVSYTQSPLLASLRYRIPGPDNNVKRALCDQLELGLSAFYTHLPQKMSAFGIDPIAQLRRLKANPEQNFTRQLIRTITALKDRHTTLRLPQPWTNLVAYVPFVIEQVYENDLPVYVVTQQLYGFDEIPVGSVVTHWNGTPIHLYMNAIARETQGANWAACVRLGVANLTIRPLAYVLMPGEDWVTLNYIDPEGTAQAVTTPWRFYTNAPPPAAHGAASGGATAAGYMLGLDEQTHVINKFRAEATEAPEAAKDVLTTDGILRYGVVHTPTGRCGYLRIFSFEVPDVDAFLQKLATILPNLPQNRLIIDVRGNPGGQIPAGQGLVRMLTTKPLQPAPIAFRATPSTLRLARNPLFEEWQRSLQLQSATSNVWAQAFPISAYYDAVPAYRYPGKVALIIDALCYSTTDFFAADFVDNDVGVIVGTDATTGAGGANVWPWSVLVNFAKYEGISGPEMLPGGYDLNLSMRRAYRTGPSVGLPIEDLGVPAHVVHRLTKRDLLEQNADLLAFTAAQMG
ncbi:MAG: S41 family peptidase [Pseudomonadota bacterium]